MTPEGPARTSRRAMLAGGMGIALAAGPLSLAATASARPAAASAGRELRALERSHGGRLGVFGWNPATGRRVTHRADERFPLCSTFKTLAVAAVLRDLDTDGSFLARTLHYTAEDIERAEGAPVTGRPENLAHGMTVADLCGAAMTHSDNVAANLLLAELGGPSAVTRFCRSLGDPVTRLDRWEPELNEAAPGDVRDTSSPRALGRLYARLALGDALDQRDGKRLTGWLLGNTTGDARLRAGAPDSWTVGDKTGTGRHGTTNDVGIAWTPEQIPVVMAVLSTRPDAGSDARHDDALIAEAADVLARALG